MINFTSTKYIVRIARYTAGMIIAHPLKVVRVVTASFKLAGIPGPKAFALCAEHLVASFSFVNGNLAIWAWFSVVLQKSDRSDGVRVANV